MGSAEFDSVAGEPAVSYTRMSKLNEKGERIKDQDAQIGKFTEASSGAYRVLEKFSDNGIGAWREDVVRPDFERLLAALRAGRVRVVVAWRASRITRDPVKGAEFGALMKKIKGKLLISDGTVFDFTTAAGRAAWHDATGQSSSDSDQKSELIREMHRRKRENLEYQGGRLAFGWTRRLEIRERKVVSVWEVDPTEAAIMKDIASKLRAGRSPSSICGELARAGVRTHSGRHFTITTIIRMMRHPRVAGYHTAGAATSRQILGRSTNFPAILDETEWRETVAALDAAAKRKATGSRIKRVYAGYYRCVECNTSLRWARHSGTLVPAWRHPHVGIASSIPCSLSFGVPADPADDLMDRLITDYLHRRPWEKTATDGTEKLHAERTVTTSKLDALADDVVSGAMSNDLAGRIERKYKTRIAEIDSELARIARLTIVVDGDEAARQWASGDLTERRRVLSAILDTVIVSPGRKLPLHERLDVQWKEQTA
jgi:DNA invertase Pin-like site-specific DNA recombinase